MAEEAKKSSVRVVITGAAGQIGYSLIPLFATGLVFGPSQTMELVLLDIEPAMKALNGVAMEIHDGAYPLVSKLVLTADANEAFDKAQYAVLVGGFPRRKGMLRKDLLAKNAPIFKAMGEALEKHALETCKVLVVANPANTNCLIASTHAPKIAKKNFSAMTRLDANRAASQLSQKLGVTASQVSNCVIFGNHSATQVPVLSDARVNGKALDKGALDQKWIRGEFTATVQQRGKAIIEARGLSSAMSAANAAKDALRDWVRGTGSESRHVSMAVWSNGNPYGISDGIFYSFPVTCKDGDWHFVDSVTVSEEVKQLMKASEKELLEEKQEAMG